MSVARGASGAGAGVAVGVADSLPGFDFRGLEGLEGFSGAMVYFEVILVCDRVNRKVTEGGVVYTVAGRAWRRRVD